MNSLKQIYKEKNLKSLSFRVYRFLFILFSIQLIILGVGLGSSYLYFKNKNDKEIYDFIRKIDPVLKEEIVFSIKEGNAEARDIMINSFIRSNDLNHAFYLSKDKINNFVKKNIWKEPCTVPSQSNSSVCFSRNDKKISAIIPLAYGNNLYGYLIQQTAEDKILSPASYPFFIYIALALIAAFILNVIGFSIYFKKTLNREVATLTRWVKDNSDKVDAAELPYMRTQELWLIGSLFKKGIENRKRLAEDKSKADRKAENWKLVWKVIHNIKSPLAGLESTKEYLASKLSEKDRLLLNNAIGRIYDILHELKNFYETKSEEQPKDLEVKQESLRNTLLFSPIQSVISEKRNAHKNLISNGLSIEGIATKSSHTLFSNIQLSEFKSVISNIVENSIESFPKAQSDKIISIKLYLKDGECVIEIKDNGKGIPEKYIKEVIKENFTHGKTSGTGYGLYHASKVITLWGGRISIESKEGVGTTVKIALKKSVPPKWFVPEIVFNPKIKYIICDDDPSIHNIIGDQLSLYNAEIESFTSPEELYEWYFLDRNDDGKNLLYFIDYQYLNSDTNGIELIKRLGIQGRSTLVTSHYEDGGIINQCLQENIKLIPKDLIGYIPFSFEANNNLNLHKEKSPADNQHKRQIHD